MITSRRNDNWRLGAGHPPLATTRRCWVLWLLSVSLSLIGSPDTVALASGGGDASAKDILYIESNNGPRDGVTVLSLGELWRLEGDNSEEVSFGQVVQASMGPDGNYYLLDPFVGILVLSRDGEYIKTLSHAPRCPLERCPLRCFLFGTDEALILFQVGSVSNVCVNTARDARGTRAFHIPGCEWGALNVFDGERRNGRLLLAGTYSAPIDGNYHQQRYTTVLSLFATDGQEGVRYFMKQRVWDPKQHRFREQDEYFPAGSRWALDEDGRVHVAPLRDDYEIHTYSPEGSLQRVIRRDLIVPERSPERRAVLEAAVQEFQMGSGTYILSETEPAISHIRVDDDGSMWVLHAASALEQAEGIMQTYDVFDSQGLLIRQVAVGCDGKGESDALFFLGDGHVLRVTGILGQGVIIPGAGIHYPWDYKPSTVVCYQIAE